MKTVMVVDDDLDIQLLLRLELTAEGYDVVTANNGREAVEMVPSVQPDCILLDIMMPELDGWGVLAELERPLPSVLVVSGLATDRDQHLAYAVELGALGFVSKPFDPGALLDLVANAVNLTPEGREHHRQALLAKLAEG